MITEYRIKGSLGIACGMLCHLGGFIAINLKAPVVTGYIAQTAATLILTYACVNYVRAKGYSPLLGLPALIPSGFVGLVIACILPDRTPPEFTSETQRQAHEKLRAAAKRDNRPTTPPN